jgi:glycosyltransferase involved in cell wall biosynthesis
MRPLVSIVVPIYNEALHLDEALPQIFAAFGTTMAAEFIVVNDGSTDSSAEIAASHAASRQDVTVITHETNYGKGRALRNGIEAAKGDVIAFCDSDTELDPVELRQLIESLLEKDYPVVYGARRFDAKRGASGLIYTWGNKFLNITGNLLFGSSIQDMETAYKIFKADVI